VISARQWNDFVHPMAGLQIAMFSLSVIGTGKIRCCVTSLVQQVIKVHILSAKRPVKAIAHLVSVEFQALILKEGVFSRSVHFRNDGSYLTNESTSSGGFSSCWTRITSPL